MEEAQLKQQENAEVSAEPDGGLIIFYGCWRSKCWSEFPTLTEPETDGAREKKDPGCCRLAFVTQ